MKLRVMTKKNKSDFECYQEAIKNKKTAKEFAEEFKRLVREKSPNKDIASFGDEDGWNLFYQYLREEMKFGKREFRIAFQGDSTHFIVHPMNKDGKTIDLVLTHGDVI